MSESERIAKELFRRAKKANLNKIISHIMRRNETLLVAEYENFPLYAEYVDDGTTMIEFYLSSLRTDYEIDNEDFAEFLRINHPEKLGYFEYDEMTDDVKAFLLAEMLEELFDDWKENFDDVPDLIDDVMFDSTLRLASRR